jgi:glycosyltransferase involved in cell wall biosynthesis
MKILIVHTFYRDKGGEDAVMLAEMSLLQEAGMEVELLSFQNPGNAIHAVFSLLLSPFNVFSFIKTILKIRSFQPNVVHLHNWHFAASPSVIVASQFSKVPIVLSLHNFRLICPSATLFYRGHIYLESVHQNFPWKAVRKGVYRNSVLQSFSLAFTVFLHKQLKTWQKVDRYFVFSGFMKNIFLESALGIPEDKFVVKGNSIPDLRLKKEPERKNHFVFIGRLSAEKGLDVLLKAFAETGFKLLIYGYGPLEQEVQTFAELHPNIQFRGPLNQTKVAEELSNCSALVFPSTCFEGMPLTILEAFSTGTPVISSNIGAMSSMIEDHYNGLHFEAGNSVDLAQKLQFWHALPESEQTQYRLGARATYEKNYTPEANLKILESIYSVLALKRNKNV